MARLKRDHSGYRSYGLYAKYQQPKVDDSSKRVPKKKDTKKWCRGRAGVEHSKIRYFRRTGYGTLTSWIRTKCTVCHKEFRENDPSVPLNIELSETNHDESYPIQVKANGRAIPIEYKKFHTDMYCWGCMEWHSKY